MGMLVKDVPNPLGEVHKYNNRRVHSLTDTELDVLQREINAVLNRYPRHLSTIWAHFYLVTKVVYAVAVYTIMVHLERLNVVPRLLLFSLHSLAAGTVWVGFWCAAHTCGHNAMFRSKRYNTLIGFILHSLLLVPYFSWQYTHGPLGHHKYLNHTIKGETHVPATHKGALMLLKTRRLMGDDAFVILKIAYYWLLGWPAYLLLNVSGGRVQADNRNARFSKGAHRDHFHIGSEVLSNQLGYKVWLSTLGCVGTLLLVLTVFQDPIFWYFGPYIVCNAFLTTYTYLHHTHADLPHYGSSEWRYLKGCLSTVDRPYNPVLNHLHDYIGTHVVHHMCSGMDPRIAAQATTELKALLGPLYIYDNTGILKALFRTQKTCEYITGVDGVQFFKDH